MDTHIVIRAISAGHEVLEVGTKVDASSWRNREALVAQRRLKPIERPEANEPDGSRKRDGKGTK